MNGVGSNRAADSQPETHMNRTYLNTAILNYDICKGTYALIRVCSQRGAEGYRLGAQYGRKNMNGEVCTRGWLGSTNNTSEHAEGCVEVFADKIGRLRIRAVADDALFVDCS